MRIERIIIHRIKKEQSNAPTLDLSDNLLVEYDNENVNFLLEKLNDAFKKDSKVLKTEFIESPKLLFQQRSIKYIREKSDDNFYDFSELSLYRLVDLLGRATLATGGYFVFVNYHLNAQEYLGVYMVRDHKEVIFSKDETSNSFLVDTTKTINTDKLAMAARINIGKYNLEEKRYLEITNRQAHQSAYFVDWVEAVLAERSAENTENLVKLLNKLTDEEMPFKPDSEEKYSRDELKSNIHDNINSTGRMVRINDISEAYWGEDDYLVNKMEKYNLDIDHEFVATPNKLKQLKRYEIKSGKMKLTFTQKDIDQKNISAGEEQAQLIIESEELRTEFDRIND